MSINDPVIEKVKEMTSKAKSQNPAKISRSLQEITLNENYANPLQSSIKTVEQATAFMTMLQTVFK
jgi:hypothetical protein